MATDGGAAEKDMIWTLKRIWRAAYKAVKMPMSRLHSSAWDSNDHAHICVAARFQILGGGIVGVYSVIVAYRSVSSRDVNNVDKQIFREI